MVGAYSNALKTDFNGFESGKLAILSDGGWYLGGRLGSGSRQPWQRDQARESSTVLVSIRSGVAKPSVNRL